MHAKEKHDSLDTIPVHFEGTVSADCSRYVKIIDLYYCTLRRWEVHGMREDDGEDEEGMREDDGE